MHDNQRNSPSLVRRDGFLPLAGFVLAALLGSVFPLAARADQIDDQLIKAAPDLVESLEDKGFKNVGVMKFLVKKGEGPTDGNSGSLNLNLAERIENALILGLDETKPLGVIHDATEVAARDPKFSVKSAEARKAHFTHKYPLAWGAPPEKVSPDAFLTGTIDLSKDMKKANLTIAYYDKSGVVHELKSLEMRTDRSILADSGQSFAISKRMLRKKNRSLEELDEDASKSAEQADKGTSIDKQLGKDNETAPIKFQILYGETEAPIKADDNSPGEYQVNTPEKGQVVNFDVTNTSANKIGLVVKVNGVSTLHNETGEDADCALWILEPGKSYRLKGFYDNNKLDRFKVLDDEESAARLADWGGSRPRAGYIDVVVFQEGQEQDEMKVTRTLRNQKVQSRSVPSPKTVKDARAAVHKRALGKGTSKKTRGLIVEGGGTEDSVLEKDDLKNPTPSYQMHISYYKAKQPDAPK